MSHRDAKTAAVPQGQAGEAGRPARHATIPQLVGEVYEAATAAERSHLIAQLLRPLGVLSLVAVADGIFAKIRFRSGWQELNIRLEDLQNVRASHVVALVDHAQQVSVETVDGLVQLLSASPVLSGSAAAALLVSALVQRARSRQPAASESETPWLHPH